jgi:hypothetical protein
MQKIEEFVDERQKLWCIHCTRLVQGLDTNEDHVPSKSFLRKPHPHHLPVVTVCKECNTGFSLDEQYVGTFLSCVLAGSTEPEKQVNASASRALADSARLRERIERSKSLNATADGDARTVWKPETDRVERVVLKNARGHAYFELGEPMLDVPSHIWAWPLESMNSAQRHDFEGLREAGTLALWPEVGSRMMNRVITGEDLSGPWTVVQDGIYRYSVSQFGGLRVRSVLSEYLATEVLWEH